jgi:hypothetical protein
MTVQIHAALRLGVLGCTPIIAAKLVPLRTSVADLVRPKAASGVQLFFANHLIRAALVLRCGLRLHWRLRLRHGSRSGAENYGGYESQCMHY